MAWELQTKLELAHRANIDRYRRILETYLTDEERDFVELRLAEEQAALERTEFAIKSREVLACARVDEMPAPATRSFICQCAQCNTRIWVAHRSPIEPIRLCLSCSMTYQESQLGTATEARK